MLKVAEKNSCQMTRPEDIYTYLLKENYNFYQEEMYVVVFNNSQKFITKQLLFKGGLANVVIDLPSLFRTIYLTNGNNFIIAHNHPSNELNPSEQDLAFTKKVRECANILGLNFLDHIIFGDSEFLSLRKEGVLL